jgi:glucose-6-phosphate isomerase
MNEVLKSFLINFSLKDGLSPDRESIKRQLSNMNGMYSDQKAYEQLIKEDPLIYEFYDCGILEKESSIAFGTSITYPGKVGNEYFMTKGHFHNIMDTAEVYYCLSGCGYMMMETMRANWETQKMTTGTAVYVPGNYAHRSINTSDLEPLVTFFAFRGDAGHDYGKIESKGFRKLIVEKDGQPEIIDNPKWEN